LSVVDIAQYKNSFQGVGYGVILDKLAASLGTDYRADYYVDYLVYKTNTQEYLTYPFLKTPYQRAKWLSQLIVETETIELYQKNSLFPTHGESCYNYYRQCKYFGMCESDLELLKSTPVSNRLSDADFAEAFSVDVLLGITPAPSNVVPINITTEPKPEEFDFIISFEELVARQYENLTNSTDVTNSTQLTLEL
ncbi:MAG: hypothetical protein ACRCUS_01800, partial [Anaerovoracaceae bacterium]